MGKTIRMQKLALIFGFLLGPFALLHGQPWFIQGTIENCEEGKIMLASYYGDRFRVIDSLVSQSGSFHFILSENAATGIYRIIFTDRTGGVRSQNRFVEFIANRESLEINVASTDRGPVPYFEASLENQVYAQFMEFELEYEAQLMSLYRELSPTRSGKETRHDSAVNRYNFLQSGRIRYMDSITGLYPDLYAVRIMNSFRAPAIPGEMTHRQRIDTLKACFFDQAAIDDPLLLSAPVYPFKLIDYLSLYKVDTLSREQQDREFIGAVDQIMLHVPDQEELRAFVVEFLLEGFELLDMEQAQLHLVEHYLDQACETDLVELIYARMEAYKGMARGQRAPDFLVRDIGGASFRLSDLSAPYVLVIFWASSCDHCQDLLPELQKWYLEENRIGLEVVAISIDTSVSEFNQYIENLKPPWITVHDSQGWYGKVPSAYHLYATPSLFLLDSEQTILARPVGFRQFQRAIRKLQEP